ncbi:hypothetical protein SDC9_161289 [bioreactor metagenome]|uniref:Uncharacterized protein n=1 Tax=bioreactor metagenome TaxID=1076179 RepID=A0A645FP50_9ZZZZ
MINFVAGHIGIVPCTLAHCADAGQDPRRHFGCNTYFTAVVKDPHQIAICNTTLLGIDRIDPHFLTAGRLQNIDIAVAGVVADEGADGREVFILFFHVICSTDAIAPAVVCAVAAGTGVELVAAVEIAVDAAIQSAEAAAIAIGAQ